MKTTQKQCKKEEILDQLKMLEQKDTENRIQQALGKTPGCDLSISVSVGQDSHGEQLYEIVVEERGRDSVKNEKEDSDGESALNKLAVQLDCLCVTSRQKINLPTNQRSYDTFETTVGKLSARRIQICCAYFSLVIF